jgi:hypothetical protein
MTVVWDKENNWLCDPQVGTNKWISWPDLRKDTEFIIARFEVRYISPNRILIIRCVGEPNPPPGSSKPAQAMLDMARVLPSFLVLSLGTHELTLTAPMTGTILRPSCGA